MGWFWNASGAGQGKDQDPLHGLDPALREFLAKESPVKYSSSNPPAKAPAPEPKSTAPLAPPSAPVSDAQQSQPPAAPTQSLYKDGRYAHLWKTYQSQAEVESTNKTDQEKITDVIEGYNYRKAEIGRAALENCAVEQWDVNECFRSGDWVARFTMCRAESRKLERCYLMQTKFLKALGYLSTFDRPESVDEQIQMHADKLYHRMLEQERAIEAAKEAGQPVPTFPALLATPKPAFSQSSSPAAQAQAIDDAKTKVSQLSPSVQASLKKRLEGLKPEERELEEKAIQAEIQAGEQIAANLGTVYQKQKLERQRRKEEGKESIGDKISSIFGSR